MVNPSYDMILEWIQSVLGNLVRTYNIKDTYIYKNYLRSLILAFALFLILSAANWLKGYSPVQFLFGRDIIIPIKNMVDW